MSSNNTLSKAQFQKSGRGLDYAEIPIYNSSGKLTQYYKIGRASCRERV